MIQQKLADSVNWTLLHVLIVIYEERAINAAANRLKITQSAVSQNLKTLKSLNSNSKNSWLFVIKSL